MWRLLLAALLLSPAASPESLEFRFLKESVLEDRLLLADPDQQERLRRLRDLFQKSGCEDLVEQQVRKDRTPNLICTVPAADPAAPVIVVGAHYSSHGGDPVIDNWASVALLPAFAELMREKPRRHTFRFAAFFERVESAGARAYLGSLGRKGRKQVAAAITLNWLGQTPLKCSPRISNKKLVQLASRVARALNVEFSGVDLTVKRLDASAFDEKHIPALALHSAKVERLTDDRRDVCPTLSWKHYYDSYRVVSALLEYMDRKLGQ